nr:AbrB/MazE/SpoVT family DNA-binding domain-containing protein [Paenibacillus xylanexedens]
MNSSVGIVRRIDDLGRVVIPKEIRQMMKIVQDDPLELFFDHENAQIMVRKYEVDEINYKELWDKFKCSNVHIAEEMSKYESELKNKS